MTIQMSAGNAFFGELYLRTTRPFLTAQVTAAEVAYLHRHLDQLSVEGPVLDIGCGHGRHLQPLAAVHPGRRFIGVDFDALSLRDLRAVEPSPVTRGDFFALPFRQHAFAAAYAWYNTLFTFEDQVLPSALREIARCVKSRGLLIVQGTWWEWAAARPTAEYEGQLGDGSHLSERTIYNAARGRDEIRRCLTSPDGRAMAASFFIRYYPLDVLEALLDEAGFKTVWAHGSVEGHLVSPSSSDMIVGAVKRG